jgi:16S rRNA (guanine1207-N2)-methyltransferase
MHSAEGASCAAVARLLKEGALTALDAHVTAVEATSRTLAANGVAEAQVLLSDCGQTVLGQTFDAVLSHLPKGRAVWEQTVNDAAALLRPGGVFYLAGANDAGVKSAAKYVRQVFGEVTVLGYRGGCRVVCAVRSAHVQVPESAYYRWHTRRAEAGGTAVAFITKPGLFSWDRLDDGTRLLIEALEDGAIEDGDRVLDIGCGAGVLTQIARRHTGAENVWAVDADCRAVEATRRTLALSGGGESHVLLSDCTEAVGDRPFDVVISNPPFHRERATTYAIAAQIIRDAARLLARRGRLYLVANAFPKYRPLIETAFGRAELLRRDNRYCVWSAVHG